MAIKYSTKLPIDVIHDPNIILKVVYWCHEQFGAGNFGKTIFKTNLCYWSFYYEHVHTNYVLFNFSTQQQLDWFTLKWL